MDKMSYEEGGCLVEDAAAAGRVVEAALGDDGLVHGRVQERRRAREAHLVADDVRDGAAVAEPAVGHAAAEVDAVPRQRRAGETLGQRVVVAHV